MNQNTLKQELPKKVSESNKYSFSLLSNLKKLINY